MISKLSDKSNAGKDPLQDIKHLIPKPKIYQTYKDSGPSAAFPKPDYMSIINNNIVNQDVIDSLGGIEDTIKPMQESLIANELRPYDYIRNYKQEIERVRGN